MAQRSDDTLRLDQIAGWAIKQVARNTIDRTIECVLVTDNRLAHSIVQPRDCPGWYAGQILFCIHRYSILRAAPLHTDMDKVTHWNCEGNDRGM